MILVAIDFTKRDLTHMDEHTLACNIRDCLLRRYVDKKDNYEFSVRELGKPYIVNSDITFSVSHTNGCVACAFCTDRVIGDLPLLPEIVTTSGVYILDSDFPCEIGLDIEMCSLSRTAERMSVIATRYFSDGERAMLENSSDKHYSFYQIWTRKESFVKCTGEGMKAISTTDTTNLSSDSRILELKLQNEDTVYAASICLIKREQKI